MNKVDMGLFPVLGSLQLEILKAIAESPTPLVVNQLAKALNRTQATVFKSVNSLVGEGILRAERETEGIRRFLQLTDKGVCYVLVCFGINYEALLKNHPYLKPFSEVPIVQRLVLGPRLRSEVYADIAYDAVMSDDFDQSFTKEEHHELDIDHLIMIMKAVSSSLHVEEGFEINRKEIDSFISEIKRAEMNRLDHLSQRFDTFERAMKQGIKKEDIPSL